MLTSANPFANCAILLRNGVELRRLALASCLYHGCTSTWFGTLEAYRSDAIGWSPDFILGYESVFFLSTAVSTALVVPTLIARWGNRRLFQIWSYVVRALKLHSAPQLHYRVLKSCRSFKLCFESLTMFCTGGARLHGRGAGVAAGPGPSDILPSERPVHRPGAGSSGPVD